MTERRLKEKFSMQTASKAQPIALGFLQDARDESRFSTRNTSKGALVPEIFAVCQAIRNGLTISEAKPAVLSGRVLMNTSYETKRKIWNALNHRYFSISPEWVVGRLADASCQGTRSSEFLSLAYLYYAIRDRITFEFVIGPVWSKWQDGVTSIGQSDFHPFFEKLALQSPYIKSWRESSVEKLASNTLSALRDFGILKGKQRKHIQRPAISSEAVFHLLCILFAQGKQGRAVLDADEWRLFLWDESDVSNALHTLAQLRWIKFEKAGHSVILHLVRIPEAAL